MCAVGREHNFLERKKKKNHKEYDRSICLKMKGGEGGRECGGIFSFILLSKEKILYFSFALIHTSANNFCF